MNLFRWRKQSLASSITGSCISQVDIDHLDRSMHLLHSTTAEVSKAAVDAARSLEQKLQNAEHRFNSTIDNISDLVIIKDSEGRWKKLNKTGQEMFGWRHGEFYNKTDVELAELYPCFRETLAICKYTDNITWSHQKPYRVEETIPNGDSERILDVVKTPVFNEDGSPKELVIVGRDITDVKDKHRRMSACFKALNSASDIIAILDSKGFIFFCNDRFLEEFGVNDYRKITYRKLEDVTGDVDENMWPVVQQNQHWFGSYKDHLLSVTPVMNGAPRPIYYVCTFKNINKMNTGDSCGGNKQSLY